MGAAPPDSVPLTQSQSDALKWLRAHNGTGVFDKNGGAACAVHARYLERSAGRGDG